MQFHFAALLALPALITAAALPSATPSGPALGKEIAFHTLADVAKGSRVAAAALEPYSVKICEHNNNQGCVWWNFDANPGQCIYLGDYWNDKITGVDPGAGNFCQFYHDINCPENGARKDFIYAISDLSAVEGGFHNDKFSSVRCFRA